MLVISYLNSSLRSLLRRKTYLLINLMGLSVGIAAYLMIMLYVTHEKGFDKHIEKRDNLFRVVEIQNEPGVGNQHVAITMGPLARELKNTFPQIKEAARIVPAYNFNSVRSGNKLFRENNMLMVDPEIIDMFSIRFIKGNPKEVLKDPQSIVISEDVAKKYFITVENAMNSILLLNERSFKVDGIIENQSKHSHLYFNMLIPISYIENDPDYEWMKHWGANSFVTYLLLDDPASEETIEKALPKFVEEKIFTQNDGWEYLELYLQPLNDIYLKSQHIKFQMVAAVGDSKTVLIFAVVAILTLLIACINYINISLARSVKQAREVGMRKVLGADRGSLVYRFISESFIVTLIAIVFAIGLLELMLPEINKVLSTSFKIDFTHPFFNIGLVVLLIIISLISGSYPAFYLSRYQPITVLKAGITATGRSGFLSKILIVFQFAISIGLIFSIMMINDQIKYIQKKDIGIKYDNTLFLFFGQEDYKKLDVFKQILLENPAISSVSGSSFLNGVSGSQGPIFIDDSPNTRLAVRYGFVDDSFFPAMGIDFIEGRNFDSRIPTDSTEAVILNEAAMRKLGWDNIEGKSIRSLDEDSLIKPKVIGVIKDYHYYTLKSLIEPAAYFYIPNEFRGVTIKYAGQMERQKVEDFIETKWKEIYPNTPYLSVSSVEYLKDGYKADLKIRTLFVYFAIISMFLSAIGLFGLTSLLIEQKTKIIGIKKVLGSPVYVIVINLIKEYIFLVGLAGIIAIPVSVIFIKRFLDAYPYRVEISIGNIAASLTIALLIAFITIIFKAGKTANSNPLEALKYE